jgi:hypothetical protein
MKKVIAVAGIGAAIAVGTLMGAGAANASEGSFIYAANNEGWYDNNPGGTVRLGYQVCNLLHSGYSEYTAMDWVYHHTDSTVTIADAGQLVSMAEDHLC